MNRNERERTGPPAGIRGTRRRPPGGGGTRPAQVALTWRGCPRTTLTVTWRTNRRLSRPFLLAGPEPDGNPGALRAWEGVSERFDPKTPRPPVRSAFWLHRVELAGLRPGTLYRAILPHSARPESFTFLTAPEDGTPLVFCAFADTHIWPVTDARSRRRESLFRTLAGMEPLFVMAPGDLWYANMQARSRARVDRIVDAWFDDWHEGMATPGGRRIPILPAEGNHDGNRDGAPFFHRRFPMPGPQFHSVTRFGATLAVITLNSDHSVPIAGAQTRWLKTQLEANRDCRWILVQHHVSPYPGYLEPDGNYGEIWEPEIRRHWAPLYEEYGVDLVISGHDHTCTRSHPMRRGRIDEERGVRYLVANSLGANRPDPGREYIAETVPGVAFWKISCRESRGVSRLRAEPVFPFEPGIRASGIEREKPSRPAS